MRNLAALTSATLLLPGRALAAGGDLDLAGTLARTAGSLIVVVGIILILYYLAGKLMKVPKGGSLRYIRVLETRHLAPKKSLLLVEVGGEYLLLGSSGEGVTLIKQIDLLEEIEVVEDPAYAELIPLQLRKKLAALSGQLAPGRAAVAELDKSGGLA